ncbi:DUF1800 domain-containing protein [Wenzhouxiangella marina]|uniref:Uncharacterized protein n=1 Tax=Wenzhouxiangella marina TaxID=1579979 RepID=A0A0K0Y073_9GAMM|nr:DUF1800 domain-containing protein [Wenzhouxiangella marina]AKS43287.1 hypothetical protein WM2015_2932 [Wenzhouxiangella marina]MBB6087023.1 uncharacterized protein (DUF1800 family) [Wenzhouxiangella marina]
MKDPHPVLENPSRRKLFKSRTKDRTLLRQDIAAHGAPVPNNLSDAAEVPPFAVRVLTRMGFGLRRTTLAPAVEPDPDRIFASRFDRPDLLGQDDVAYFESLGNTDDQRLERYVDEQLSDDLPDPDWEARKAAYPNSFDILDEDLATTYSERECAGFSQYVEPQRQIERAAFTRACYSRRQLLELMADFWHNHFNVFSGGDEDIYVSWADWDKTVIRGHAFGNFHDMLQASAKHPAMLYYLDNYANEAGGFNENYARELFELHTLGAINYLGNTSPLDAPALPTNPYAGLGDPLLDALQYSNPAREIQSEYTDTDVYEAARALTGWRYDDQDVDDGMGNCISGGTGAFLVDEGEHDGGPKAILSRNVGFIPADGGAVHDGEVAIKLAAYHPGTARYIALKLCQRLISDNPPETVVQAAADTFYANRRDPRQIAKTLRTILLSDEFKDPATWGQKIKRPFEYVVSAMRAARCDYTWRFDDSDSDRMLSVFNNAGQRLYWWRTPDGYPDERAAWMGSSTLVQNWRLIDWLLDENNNDDVNRVMRVVDTTLEHFPGNPTPRELVAFWCHWILGFTPDGGWVGPIGTFYSNEPTALGRACMQFITQQGFPIGEENAPPFPADQFIPRNELRDDPSPNRWYRRLRGMVALILWSPNFMQR